MSPEDVDLVLGRLGEAQTVLAAWLRPDDAIADQDALRRLLSILDDRHLVRTMGRLRQGAEVD
ncbi:hypothetical protein [Lutibaculum baratangense]|uniref:Uncharacterized protein n=1 Tax=Lutibaculum baratangense AMV1 TaxID=631454 RepID=V4QWR1_9HYPH|nr:hypothetical protein [Lutibaculum baratangense]ESR24207.1 hypothetical protein N177_2656 [Lutibaculum baratangense AMV1]